MTPAQVLRNLAALPSRWLSDEQRKACAEGAAALDREARRAEEVTREVPVGPQGVVEPGPARR